MQALSPDAQHGASMYFHSGGPCSGRQLSGTWPASQLWDGAQGLAGEQGACAEAKPEPCPLQQQQQQLASMARLQCVGNLQAALLSGIAPPGGRGHGQGMEAAGPFDVQEPPLSVDVPEGMNGFLSSCSPGTVAPLLQGGMISLPAGMPYNVPASQDSGLAGQLPLNASCWQRTFALAAMQQAAAARQGMYASSGLSPLAGAQGRTTPPMTSLGSALVDEKEIKCQKRKLSNRESARRSRLRKQAELQDMVHDVRKYTVTNAHLKLEMHHLRRCAESLTRQNAKLKAELQKFNSAALHSGQPAHHRGNSAPLESPAGVQGLMTAESSGSPPSHQDSEAAEAFDGDMHAFPSNGVPCGQGNVVVAADVQELVQS
eukprot:evm.model.scf_564EXC.6 EVM.evm.TU.scf_564EXC.6   scf_564EXC:31255-35342(+)